MSEENTPTGAADSGSPTGPQFVLQKIYLKDLSFEAPLGAAAFQKENWNPKINQDLNTQVNKLDDDTFDVVFKLTINASIEDRTVFLVEVQQAGIFTIKGFEPQQFAQVVNTVCPATLFPYTREVVDSCVVKGGFPALNLPPINFDALFIRAMQKAQAAQAEKESTNPVTN